MQPARRRQLQRLAPSLLDWYAAHARDLPWRRTSNPYAIWISEVMLQQTQAATVIPYWKRWLAALPTVHKLARAREQTILRLWAGLGYYSRVRRLRQAARLIVQDHNGRLPSDPATLQTLPGIGPYTAGAIASIAFEQPAPLVDGNITRVFSRLHGLTQANDQELWAMAKVFVQAAHATGRHNACGDLNQSLMEIGATVCTPRQPICALCPLRRSCVAHRTGDPTAFPAPVPRPRLRQRRVLAFLIQCRGRYLVEQRPAKSVNAGLWEFPNTEAPAHANTDEIAANLLPAPPQELTPLTTIKHTITHTRFQLEAFTGKLKRTGLGPGCWLAARELARLPWTAAHRRLLACAGLAAAKRT